MLKDVKDELISFYLSEGQSCVTTAKKFGYAQSSVNKFLKNNGIELKIKYRESTRLTKKEKLEIIELYKTGKESFRSIAIKYGKDNSSIKSFLNNIGIKNSRSPSEISRMYGIDETFFDNIDTQEKAYILGFLYADGGITLNAVSISQKSSEIELISRIKKEMKSEHPIKEFNDGLYISYVFTSKRMAERLIELGCYRKKTFILEYPKELRPELDRHFIRGYFDGDGCITKNYDQISIVGTEKLLTSMQNILIEEVGLSKTKMYNRHKRNNITTLMYNGSRNCKKFSDWLYEGATIYMKRKKDIFDAKVIKR